MESTNLKGLKLYCLQELGRLLCWPAPKLAECLQCYIPRLHKSKIVLKDSRPNSKPKGLVTDRTIQRYLEKCGITTNVKKVWPAGSVAVHAVQIVWWEHDPDISRVIPVSVGAKEVTGWLLMMTDRELVGAKNTDARDLRVRLALLPGERRDYERAIRIIAAAISTYHNHSRTVYLVADNQGATAIDNPDTLRDVLPHDIDLVLESATSVKGRIEIPASFPNPRSVENYLAMIMLRKAGTPKFRDAEWKKIHDNISDDNVLATKLDAYQPFLSRRVEI